MQDLLNQLVPILTTTTIAIIVAIVGYTCKEVVKLVPSALDFVVAKIGLTNYQKIKLIGFDVWNLIEEQFRLSDFIGDKVQAKVKMFETLIKQKVPGITDADIELLRQSIAGEVNKGKTPLQYFNNKE